MLVLDHRFHINYVIQLACGANTFLFKNLPLYYVELV